MTSPIDKFALLVVLARCRALVSRSEDSVWSCLEVIFILEKLNRSIRAIESSSPVEIDELRFLFAPTGPLQETSLSNGWDGEFLGLAARLDEIIATDLRMKPLSQQDIPAPLFQRFERVRVAAARPQFGIFAGERGTVVWHDSSSVRQPDRPNHWIYIVHLPRRSSWTTFVECDLESEGTFDTEADHLSDRAEISFDTVLDEDNDYLEGSYRLPGGFWQVVAFKKEDVPEICSKPGRWERATKWEETATGLLVSLPRNCTANREFILKAMAQVTGIAVWVEVCGPDSMHLR